MTQPDIATISLSVANALWQATPGDLSAARRLALPAGAPLFWRLAAKHAWSGTNLDTWAAITRMLALLTPTGTRPRDGTLHDTSRGLGAVLCDGGAMDWRGTKPVFSEQRLARLLAARGPQRLVAMERALRMLARNHPKLNVPDIAFAALGDGANPRIAKDYYARLDRAAAETKEDTGA